MILRGGDTKASSKRFGYIDSLRGFAALSVVALHAGEYFLSGASATLYTLIDPGKFGVVLFFALSGVVIPFSFRMDREATVGLFLIGRVFRLYPLYWLSLILAIAFIPGAPDQFWQILANASMFQAFFGIRDAIGLYWTLQIEWMFYILCILMYARFSRTWINRAPVLVLVFLGISLALAVARFYSGQKLPVAIPLAMMMMFWGGCGRLENGTKLQAKLLLTIILLLVPITVLAYNVDQGYHETWYRYFLSYSLAGCVFFVFGTKLKATHPITEYLGRISYSMYLLHPIVIAIAMKANLHGGVGVAAVFATTIAVSSISFHLLESPFIGFGRRLSARIK